MEHLENFEKELNKKIAEIVPKGSLFDSINYVDDESLDRFMCDMNREQAIYVLIESAKAAYRRGSFKIEESEAVSKALRILVD
jgi:hypothetical protein